MTDTETQKQRGRTPRCLWCNDSGWVEVYRQDEDEYGNVISGYERQQCDCTAESREMIETDMQALEEIIDEFLYSRDLGNPFFCRSCAWARPKHRDNCNANETAQRVRELFKQQEHRFIRRGELLEVGRLALEDCQQHYENSVPIAKVREMLGDAALSGLQNSEWTRHEIADAILKEHDYEVNDD